jgi:4-diphosphocytidyl-2-C-methyl-D-erythritol kinase
VRKIRITAFAKVNLGLRILGKRDNGYHNIESVLQTVSLADEIEIETRGHSIEVSSDNPDLPVDESNLCYRAARLFLEGIGDPTGVAIHIEKRIPVGAGLGGGSSDAASVLTGLDILFSSGLDKERLREMALLIGSDVPFFLEGGTSLVGGRGERIEPVRPEPTLAYLIVYPGFSVDTKWAYGRIKSLTKNANYSNVNIYSFIESAAKGGPVELHNDFEEVMLIEYPELSQIRELLNSHDARAVSLSGSGSSVFGIFHDGEELNGALADLSGKGYWVQKAYSIQSSKIPQFSLTE